MSWNDAGGLAPETAFIGEAALRGKSTSEQFAEQQQQQQSKTKALRLRNGGAKKWAVAHIPIQESSVNPENSTTTKLPKIKSARS